MKSKKILTASSQNYIKAIAHIEKIQKAARVKDISKHLSIGPSSVSEALKPLAEKGYINYQPYGIITLTAQGEKIAEEITNRHNIMCNFLETVLMVDKETADKDATKIEYEVSEEVLEKFVRFLTFMQTCSCKEPKWIKSFKHYSTNGKMQEKCKICVSKNKEGINNSHCCGMDSTNKELPK